MHPAIEEFMKGLDAIDIGPYFDTEGEEAILDELSAISDLDTLAEFIRRERIDLIQAFLIVNRRVWGLSPQYQPSGDWWKTKAAVGTPFVWRGYIARERLVVQDNKGNQAVSPNALAVHALIQEACLWYLTGLLHMHHTRNDDFATACLEQSRRRRECGQNDPRCLVAGPSRPPVQG